jgi:hypothetical protein
MHTLRNWIEKISGWFAAGYSTIKGAIRHQIIALTNGKWLPSGWEFFGVGLASQKSEQMHKCYCLFPQESSSHKGHFPQVGIVWSGRLLLDYLDLSRTAHQYSPNTKSGIGIRFIFAHCKLVTAFPATRQAANRLTAFLLSLESLCGIYWISMSKHHHLTRY